LLNLIRNILIPHRSTDQAAQTVYQVTPQRLEDAHGTSRYARSI
jgi:hypothetical protein